jgi:hypothetical protein
MSHATIDHDKTDEDILTGDIPDEALEAAADNKNWAGIPSLAPLCPSTLRFCD